MKRTIVTAGKMGFSRRQKAVLLAATIGLSSGMLTGCGKSTEANSTPEPEPVAVATAQETPNATETQGQEKPQEAETPAPAPVQLKPEDDIFHREPLPESLQKYKDMNAYDFNSLPVRERYLYVSYLNQYRPQYAETFHKIAHFYHDIQVTPDSSIEDVLEDFMWQVRLATYPTDGEIVPAEDGTCGQLDKRAFNALIANPFVNPYEIKGAGTNSDIAALAKNIFADMRKRTGKNMGIDGSPGVSICPSALAKDLDINHSTSAFDVVSESRKQVQFEGQEVTAVTIQYHKKGNHGENIDDPNLYERTFYIVPVQDWKGVDRYTTASSEETIV
ncbi:hypothetical protein ACUH9Y_09005, partial [Dermabacteraceae bacterium P13115]